MVLALQSHSSRYALKMSMSGPGFKPQGHLCLERMGRRLASTIKCFENWQRCSNFVIFYQIHSPPCNTKWCIFNYMQTCWINFSYGHDMLHDSGTWVASVAQTWHVCVCVTHCISHAYKACRRASASHCSAEKFLASSVTRMRMNCSSALVCATPAPVVGMRLPMILYTFKQTRTFDKNHRFVKNSLLPICLYFFVGGGWGKIVCEIVVGDGMG